MSVFAVVLTYNAPNALRRCLESLRAQTLSPDTILVVDNASDPPAAALESLAGDRFQMRVLTLSSNTGPAGGHAAGLAQFLDSQHDFGWIMDDDCIPEPTCLELLVGATARCGPRTLLFPTWINENTGRDVNYPAWSGFLIPRSIVASVGLPRADFFWWAEDTEYLHWRIPEHGYCVERIGPARVLHSRVRVNGEKPAWKVYYEVRNTVYYRLWIQRRRGRRFYRLGRSLIRLLGGVVVSKSDRTLKLYYFVRAIRDGLLGRLGATVPVQIAERSDSAVA